MRKILLTIVGIASTALGKVYLEDCYNKYGTCLFNKQDLAYCISEESSCFIEAQKDFYLSVQTYKHSHHDHDHRDVKVSAGSLETCQKNCGIETAKCLITTFDPKGCAQKEATCALDCFKGVANVATSYFEQVSVKKSNNKPSGKSGCLEDCALDLGMCLT